MSLALSSPFLGVRFLILYQYPTVLPDENSMPIVLQFLRPRNNTPLLSKSIRRYLMHFQATSEILTYPVRQRQYNTQSLSPANNKYENGLFKQLCFADLLSVPVPT